METRLQQAVEKTLYSIKSSHPHNSKVVAPIKWMPTVTWDNQDLLMPHVTRDAVATASFSWFGIKVAIAISFGFIKWDASSNAYVLGPNAIPIYPSYTENGTYIATAIRNTTNVDTKSRLAEMTYDVDTSTPKVDWFRVNNQNGFVYHSRAVTWRFVRLKQSFEALLNTKETVMVYSDLVQSTVMGSGRFPLLREVPTQREGNGRVTVEPYHREWIPMRSQTIDIVEIELATPSGLLTQLSPGKKLVTVGIQQL